MKQFVGDLNYEIEAKPIPRWGDYRQWDREK